MISNRPTPAPKIAELLQLAQDESVAPARAREIGAALADALMRSGSVDDAPLAAFTKDAYLGFDARVASTQAKAGIPRS